MQNINISGSYTQDQRHAKVSDRFNPIQASQVGEIMASRGLNLVSVSTGNARHEDKKDHQRTLSRFRGPDIADGSFLDIVLDNKHMGRGVSSLHVGIFRIVCTNGLFTGEKFFRYDIRHSGNTYDNLDLGIVAALGVQSKLADVIARMQRIVLTQEQREQMAFETAKLLVPSDALQLRHNLLSPNRTSDTSSDLWTTYNLAQENAMQGKHVLYTVPQTVERLGVSVQTERNMTARAIKQNSAKDLIFNTKLWDIAESLAA
jgi:hypothetical protein